MLEEGTDPCEKTSDKEELRDLTHRSSVCGFFRGCDFRFLMEFPAILHQEVRHSAEKMAAVSAGTDWVVLIHVNL